MSNKEIIEQKAEKAILEIRKNALKNGTGFLIYDEYLPVGQYYMEYPDGDIKIVIPSTNRNIFIVHQELDSQTVLNLRKNYHLIIWHSKLMQKLMPTLYIITGPNGAGKSSIGSSLLPDSIRNNYTPYDADKLKMIEQLRIKKQGFTYKEAGRLADEFVYEEFERRYKDALKRNDHFVYEGHFSDESSWNLIKEFKEAGYKIDMIFIGLATLKLSQDRVYYRAINGGHNVNAFDIQKNYYGNLENLNKFFTLIDTLSLIDNSGNTAIFL